MSRELNSFYFPASEKRFANILDGPYSAVRIFVLCIGLTFAGPLTAQHVVQNVKSLTQVESLDSTEQTPHRWWVTEQPVDPVAITRQVLESKNENPGSAWKAIPVPSNVRDYYPHMTRKQMSVTYLKAVVLPDEPAAATALMMGIINDRDRVYVNGTFIGATGIWDSPVATAYDKRRIYQIPAGVIRPGELNVIVAQVQGLSVDLWGMDQYRTAIGPAMTIFSSEINESFRALLFLTCYTTVGLYFFFMWARRRQDKQNLFFAVFCVLLIAYNLLRSQLRYDRGISFLELKRLEYIALYAVVPFFFLFFRSYFHLPKTKVVKVFDGLMTLVCVVLLAGIGHTLVTNDTDGWWKFQRTIVQLGCWPPLVVGSVGILVYRMFKKDKDALAMFISMILLVAAMVLDIASSMGKVNFPAIFQYVFIAFILSIGTVLSNRFLRLHREIEDLNANLEQKIETRTRELNQTVAKARAIKEQQDGDYFLTSLLIEPLSGVFSTGGPVHAESFVRQKKEFEFRKWKSDLGGDLAIVDRIGLRDKDFTVFINADAMGKSMQGAGGAVVLGTTFQSLISRTKRGINASRHPEQWLRDAFFDLQNVFVAFDGSMLVSAIFGLIDEASGTLYYINSEHPGAVLYRDKKAQFLTDAGLIRKFGIEGIEENLHVNMLRLKPDDVVILGSDGRDDLHIGEDPQGGRIINDDESLFLRIVEEAQGNLNEIVEGLTTRGQIIDDLSLIRLGYREDAPAIQTAVLPGGYESLLSAGKAAFARKDSAEARTRLEGALKLHESEEVYEMLVRCCLAQKDFRAAADLVDQATLLYPANHRLLYLALRAFKGTGQYDRAVEYGERAALRDPDNTDNLMHLADCYRLLKKSSRAQDAIRRAEKKQASPDLMRKLKGLLGVTVLAIALTPSLRAESPIQLETSRDQQWQITSDEIDPDAETRAFFSEARTSDQTVVWLPVQVPGERRGAKPGTIWLRTTLNLKEKPASSLAFRAGIIRDRDRVFINGNLIGSTGEWDASAPQAFDRSRLYEVKPDVFRTGDNLILIQIQGTPELPPAIRFGPLSLGTIQDALTRQASTAYMHGALTVVYLTIASYFLFLFLKRSEERDNLYFGLFTILVAIFTFLQSELKYQIQLSFMTFKKIELIAQFASVPAYFAFIQAFFPERRERDRGVLKVIGLSGYGIIALACILVAATSNLSIWIFVRNYGVTTGCILLVVGGAGLVYNRLRAFERDAFYFTGGLIVLAGGIIFAYLSETGILHLPNVLDGFLLIFVIINAMTLANRILRLTAQVEEMNADLERRVQRRTEELGESLEKVRALKESQDADYFLTTLLLSPLSGAKLTESGMTPSILIKQKKSFDFRKWRAEIGGDICVVDELPLKGRRYAIFMNGDAMGKSMQGAGGALVLGTVFRSLITRTQKAERFQNQTPQEWLRDCFLELQTVFVTFDGSMLVSAVFGLIDLESREMYHVNAEHPTSVLLRNGKASFVPTLHPVMKIGVRGMEDKMQVEQLLLQSGDILIAGSDGRDDVLLGYEPDGTRIINADESLFLRIVENCGGSLGKIYESIQASGGITDDLSLLAIEVS